MKTQGIAGAAALALLGALAPGLAMAQSAGTLLFRLGVTRIAPDVKSGDLSTPAWPGTKADVGADTRLTAGVAYMVSDRFSLDLPLSAGFRHEITGDGAIAGVGKIGEVKALPITLLAQARFGDADAALRPYVGLGPTFARFYKARATAALSGITGGNPSAPTTLEVDSRWGASVQLGASYRFAPGWSFDLCVLKTALKTRTTLSSGQQLDIRLDPVSYSAGVVYRF